jgi:hypothetical protein
MLLFYELTPHHNIIQIDEMCIFLATYVGQKFAPVGAFIEA